MGKRAFCIRWECACRKRNEWSTWPVGKGSQKHTCKQIVWADRVYQKLQNSTQLLHNIRELVYYDPVTSLQETLGNYCRTD